MSKKQYKYEVSEEEKGDLSDGEERPEGQGFDLRNKSLTNTTKKAHEKQKEKLPLKTIMKNILDRNRIADAAKDHKVSFDNFRNQFCFQKRRLSSKMFSKRRKMPNQMQSSLISRRKLKLLAKLFLTLARKESTKET